MEKDNRDIYPKVTIWDIYKEYWSQAKKYYIFGALTVLGIGTGTLLQTVMVPVFYKQFFDTLVADKGTFTSGPHLVSIILAVALFNFFGWMGTRIGKFSLQKFEISVMRDVRQQAYDYIILHSFNFFSNNFAGSLVQKVNRFMRAFERIADRILMDIVPLTVKIIGAGTVLFLVDKRLAFGIYIWVIIFLIISFVFNRIKLKYDRQGAAIESKVSGVISDAFSNHGSIQLFNGEKSESIFFSKENGEFARIFLKRWNIAECIDAVQALLNLGVEFFIFYYAIQYWQVGLITLGTFALAQTYILQIGGSLWQFGRIVRDLYEATADAREMVEILHLPHEIQDIPNAQRLSVPNGSIEFKNVSFAFGKSKENNKPVFKNLSLSIKPGEKVALIGSSGAGKSTFVKLLLRLHDIQSGEIFVDGQDIKNVTQDSLRENISLVPQDPALFHRTLMENIRYGKRNATDEEVIQASKLAHCDIFIKDFPLKYETFVGERGIKLSGGERQRVAIARALLKNAPILVLDEATSSLDSHSEALIQDALHTLMEGKTTLVIAHRLSTIKKMDRIIVLGKDGIIEEGNHDELLKKQGTYSKLWNLQAGGFGDKSIEELLES